MVRSGIPEEGSYSSPMSRTYMKKKGSPISLNAEGIHKDALAAAKAEHQRVRDIAVQAYRNNELREAQSRLQEKELQELKRLKLERERAETAAKLIELQRQSVPIPQPPPRSTTPPPAPIPVAKPTSAQEIARPVGKLEPPLVPPKHAPAPSPVPHQPTRERKPSPHRPPQQPSTSALGLPLKQSDPPTTSLQQSSGTLQQKPASNLPHILPGAERYLEIHRNLKQVRRSIEDQIKNDPALKAKSGDIRRQIRKSVGQLTEVRGANRVPQAKILEMLKDALFNVPSQPIDPSHFLLSTPAPNPNARNNNPTLPILFIYSLNVFAKSIIRQFIDEAGVSPKQADPVGVIAVSMFSNNELLWRGTSLISILLSKMRVVCPVLFGIRGSEKTEEGRARLGWWKNDGSWVHEQVHATRMTGLGAGYASIALRDFSKTQMENPYPPINYWLTVSSIVNTPPNEASSTQYIVLKALIENYEQRFMTFYGSAARAALQVALVDFPARALEKSVAVSAVSVLADKLKRDVGLKLDPQQGSARTAAGGNSTRNPFGTGGGVGYPTQGVFGSGGRFG